MTFGAERGCGEFRNSPHVRTHAQISRRHRILRARESFMRRAAGLLRRQRCGPVRRALAPPATEPLSAPAGRAPGLCPGITRGLPITRGSSASTPAAPRDSATTRGPVLQSASRNSITARSMSSQRNSRNSLLRHPVGMSRRIAGSCPRRHPNEPRNSTCSTTASGSRIGNRLSMFQAKADDLHFVAMMDRALAETWRWDETELDEIILSEIASSLRRADEGEGEWASKLMDRQARQAPR